MSTIANKWVDKLIKWATHNSIYPKNSNGEYAYLRNYVANAQDFFADFG